MRNIVAGNWKSNKLMSEGEELIAAINLGMPSLHKTEVIVAPPAPYLGHYAYNQSNASKVMLVLNNAAPSQMVLILASSLQKC